MPKTLATVQSSYIPWKGYFDLIRAADVFVLLDDVQYTRRDWRNRNRIKTKDGVRWLTIPVRSKGNYEAPIREIAVSEPGWNERHWRTIAASYARAPHFRRYAETVEALFLSATHERLSDINRHFLEGICPLLRIETPIAWSTDFPTASGKNERLLSLCRAVGADRYVSGPGAKGYLDVDLFARNGVEAVFFDYAGYPTYEQLFPPFDPHVSVLDLLFHVGETAADHLLSRRG